MSQPTEIQMQSVLTHLTKPKAAFIASPLIFGLALALTLFGGGERSIASDGAQVQPSKSATSPATPVTERQTGSKTPVRLAAPNAKSDAKGSFSAAQRKEIGALIRQYLLSNPELLVEVSTELENRRKKEQELSQVKTLTSEKDKIFRSPVDFVLGNPDGDITIVEYFDYNCGWCKRALNEVRTIVAKDKNVRIVMKEFPIFGEDSSFAARAALASIKQGKYWEFHNALMRAKKVTARNTLEIAKKVGIDVEALKKEMANPKYEEAIEENSRIAQALGMQGTPGFIVDSKINYGYVPADGLQSMIADIRKDGCKMC